MSWDMDLQAVHGGSIPGLQQALTIKDFELARDIFNALPKDDTLLKVQQKDHEHLRQLSLLFEKFGVRQLFGLHRPHRHSNVPDGFQMAGRTVIHNKHLYYWTKPVDDALKTSKVCGLKYIFHREQGLCPYEFHEGDLPDISKVDPEFFLAVNNYLINHDLTSTFGLLYLAPGLLERSKLEFVLTNGELLLAQMASSLVRTALSIFDIGTTVTTCWSWSSPTCTSEIRCLIFEDGIHRKVKTKPQKVHRSIDDAISAVEEEYLDRHLW
ncbi:hypothetical protein FOXYSP1_16689 [Fusarium oxysporum f. sp. phaseoli]